MVCKYQPEIIFCNEPYQDFIYDLAGIMPAEGDFVLAESTSDYFVATRKKEYNRALQGESFTTVIEENYKGDILYLEISSSPIVNHEGRIGGRQLCCPRYIYAAETAFKNTAAK